jgi:hypothetical protein
MLDQGFCAEIKFGGEHLRLFAENNALGVQASVYNLNTKKWIAPSESIDDLESAKDRAVELATAYLKQFGSVELPSLEWKRARSV